MIMESDNDAKATFPILLTQQPQPRVSRPFNHSESEQFGIFCCIMMTLLSSRLEEEKTLPSYISFCRKCIRRRKLNAQPSNTGTLDAIYVWGSHKILYKVNCQGFIARISCLLKVKVKVSGTCKEKTKSFINHCTGK